MSAKNCNWSLSFEREQSPSDFLSKSFKKVNSDSFLEIPLILPIQAAVVDGLGQMGGCYLFFSCQVSNGAADA
jgi:hypothetical protein